MLDVRRLRVLHEVARHGSLSAAAVELGYTQPAVSRQIAVLESEVGVKLLRRLPQGVVLTDAGTVLVRHAGQVIASLARAEDELRAQSDLSGGSLRMAVFASAAASFMPLALARFRDRHPGVELAVIVADPEDSLPLLRAGELDLAVCNAADDALEQTRGRPASGAGLPVERLDLFDDPMYVALPADHPLAQTSPLTLAELADESWMLATKGSCPDADLFFELCAVEGIEPRVAFQYDDYAALLGFVAAGVGISVLPDMVARASREDVIVRVPEPPLPPRPVSAAVLSGYRAPAVIAMLALLQELAPEWEAGRIATAAPETTAVPAAVTAAP